MKTADRKRNSKDRTSHSAKAHYEQVKSHCQLFLVGNAATWYGRARKPTELNACVLQSDEEVRRYFFESPRDSVWVTKGVSRLSALVRDSAQGSGDRRLLVLGEIDEVTHQVLATWFRYVVVRMDKISLLEPKELLEVLQAPNRSELFIGGAYDRKGNVIILYRGSVQPLVVPLDWFKNASSRVDADPDRLKIIDSGHGVKLGGFEAAADAILYEFDKEYRKRAKKRSIEADTSLGGAIRRLRLQRGLGRGDFGSVPVRTMARIERGEVSRPRRSTLERIANRLGVSVNALASY